MNRLDTLLRKTFDIRQGELLRASLMQLYIFLIITTLLIIKPTVNGLFLSKFGIEKLPYAFILVAIVAALVTTLYAQIVRNFPLNRIMNGTILFSVLSLIFFGLFLRWQFWENTLLFIFYIWVAIFALLTTSQFWILANLVMNAREAKRLFGFIGAGAIAGGIFGGYLTSALAPFLSSENLPFVAAIFMTSCIPINWSLWKNHVSKRNFEAQKIKKQKVFKKHPFNLVRKSKHLTFLASIIGVSVVVAKLVDYQFGGIAAALIPDPDELTAFFGFWLSTFSVISLLLQLFVTRRIVGTFGVASSLLILPGLILLAVIGLFLFPGLLAAAVFLKMSDAGIKQSVNKAAMELLILPIPVSLKNQTKTFIDVFIDSLATGISGLILIFLAEGLDLSTNAINLMIIGLLLIWFYLISRVKKEYLKSFRQSIEEPDHHTNPKELDITDESVVHGLINALENGPLQQRLIVLDKIKDLQHEDLFESVKLLLDNPSDALKVAAIKHLQNYPDGEVERKIEKFTRHTNQELRIASFDYLIQHANENKFELLNDYLNQENYRERGAALISLANQSRTNPELIRRFQLDQRIQEKLKKLDNISDKEELVFRTNTALKAISKSRLKRFYPFVLSSFFNEDLNISYQSIEAAGKTKDEDFITPLMSLLSNPRLKKSARKSLARFGIKLISKVEKEVRKGNISLEVLRQIPGVVKKIDGQQSVNFLFFLLKQDDLFVRHEVLRGLNYLSNHNPNLKFPTGKIEREIFNEANLYQDLVAILYSQTIIQHKQSLQNNPGIGDARASLIHILEKSLDRNLEKIFRLLGLKFSNGDIYVIYKGIRSNLSENRLNALEFLDNLLEPKFKKILIPLVETSMLDSFSESGLNELKLKIPNEHDCFKMILGGKNTRLKLAVLYLLEQINQEAYADLIVGQTLSTNERVRSFAERVGNKILKKK